MNAPYRTLRFAAGQIPAGLLRAHSLKQGVHAELEILEGSLRFVWENGDTHALAVGEIVHIDARPHHLEDAADASIEVRFFRVDHGRSGNPIASR